MDNVKRNIDVLAEAAGRSREDFVAEYEKLLNSYDAKENSVTVCIRNILFQPVQKVFFISKVVDAAVQPIRNMGYGYISVSGAAVRAWTAIDAWPKIPVSNSFIVGGNVSNIIHSAFAQIDDIVIYDLEENTLINNDTSDIIYHVKVKGDN